MDSKFQREAAFHSKVFSEHGRRCVSRFYSVTVRSKGHFHQLVRKHGAGKTVMEYGCGPFTNSSPLVGTGAMVVGVDLSTVAIRDYRERIKDRHLRSPSACVMNAEQLGFRAGSFGMICGIGILHHLDLNAAFRELSRALRPDGVAIFLEPLGHNPFVNLFRKLTPHLRTEDEHPVRMSDLRIARRYFGEVHAEFFHFLSLAAAPFPGLPFASATVQALEGADRVLFRLLPFARRYSWSVCLTLSRPRKDAPAGR
jgi:SAM-dependent methyltransferase